MKSELTKPQSFSSVFLSRRRSRSPGLMVSSSELPETLAAADGVARWLEERGLFHDGRLAQINLAGREKLLGRVEELLALPGC